MKTIAKQAELVLPPAAPKVSPERVFRRKDSRFWQAQYRDGSGKLVRRTTGTALEASARIWLACAQLAATRKHEAPPPRSPATDAGVPDLFTA